MEVKIKSRTLEDDTTLIMNLFKSGFNGKISFTSGTENNNKELMKKVEILELSQNNNCKSNDDDLLLELLESNKKLSENQIRLEQLIVNVSGKVHYMNKMRTGDGDTETIAMKEALNVTEIK